MAIQLANAWTQQMGGGGLTIQVFTWSSKLLLLTCEEARIILIKHKIQLLHFFSAIYEKFVYETILDFKSMNVKHVISKTNSNAQDEYNSVS